MYYPVNFVLWGLIFLISSHVTWAKCGGKTAIYDLLNGTLTIQPDGQSYLEDTYCEWLIKAPQPDQKIQLTFKNFDTECSFDILKIFDGSSRRRLLGSFSGNTLPPQIQSNTSEIVLEFISDYNYVRAGFLLDFLITDCPRNCSGHGSCVGNKCYCDELFTGVACDIEICPDFCNNATGNGQCSQSDGCQCNNGFIGESCSFSIHEDIKTSSGWYLIKDHSSVFSNRFGHASVYLDNVLWIFGGSSLNDVFDDLVKFNFQENKWQIIRANGDRPAARFRHTMVSYKDTLVVFGGELANGTLLNDLWIFNITTITWKRVHENNDDSPPGLASHCATVYDGGLIIFGGQSQDYEFSHQMYIYDLNFQSGWKNVSYKLAKISDLRLIGHSCVFYSKLKSLIVFGGYKILTGKSSIKVDTLLLYNVNEKVWLSMSTSGGPKPTAYHSSVITGDYMITYGGIVHTHSHDETCYGDKIHFLNMKNFTWSSIVPDVRNGSVIRGRYSHVAAVVNQSIMMVAGGFSGVASGELLAYKIPSNMINVTSTHLCHVFSQCVSCLSWGSHGNFLCGWCVQDSTCYPRGSLSGACSTTQTTRGWWGDKGSFLISVDQCRIQDNPPGLMAEIKLKTRLDDVYVINPLQDELPRRLSSSKYTYNVKWFGFIYPFVVSQSVDNPISLMLHGETSASLHLSTDEGKENKEKVISFKGSKDDIIELSEEAKRRELPLFPSATKDKMYYIEVKTQFDTQTKRKYLAVLVNDDLIDGRYLRPYFSGNCEQYPTCLQCLSDKSCGWCSSTNKCILRNSSIKCQHASGEDIHLVVNITYCETCGQYINCDSCFKDEFCAWTSTHNHFRACYQPSKAPNVAKQCTQSCGSYMDCGSCVNDLKCLWCNKQEKCIPWVSYPVSFIHGQCSQWFDSNTGDNQCSTCSEQKVCADCLKTPHCGWCGEFHNGSCFAGGFGGPFAASCNHLLSSGLNSKSYEWSYSVCPDENECITRRDCDKNAICFNTPGSYICECKQDYKGNGMFCEALCEPPCVHGECIKHPFNVSLDECKCDLGWTGSECDVNCGCHNHSTCTTAVGVCDECKELTRGTNCQYCVPGSFGDATTRVGCKRCECNGHGDEQRGICNDKTGHCFCMNNTMGPHCDQCLPGLSGYPKNGEGCYYPCKGHLILSNVTQGTLSSLPEQGQYYDSNNISCVWIISTVTHNSDQVVYSNKLAPGTITFRIKDISLDCQTDHIYIYDGMPNFKLDGTKSSFNLIGSLCGNSISGINAVESQSGTMVVVFDGNVGSNSQSKGFNVTFVVNQCPNSCTGNRYCHNNGTHENCVCKPGWIGMACDDVMCPANCSESLGHGRCDQILGKCVCKNGYTGSSCELQYSNNDFIWEYFPRISGSTSALARMGHTLIVDIVTKTLVIYGGYSLSLGILGDIWKYDTQMMNYIQEISNTPSSRYFHAADVYKRTMYVTGGITNEGYSSEVWKYYLNTKQWQQGQSLPRELAGHTVNVINDTLYLIGGYSPERQCSAKVYTLNMGIITADWMDLNPSGDIFDACFGHTTVYDRLANSLVVFGKKANKMEPTLAVLKLTSNKWNVVSYVSQEFLRYFHFAMIVGDVMLVTTGYTGQDIQNFAEEPLVYDLRCERWHRPQLKGTVPIFMAHSAAAVMDDKIFSFGGYNGVALDKLYQQNVSSNWCALFSTQASCTQVSNCVWCKDTASNLSSCYVSNTQSNLTCSDVINTCENAAFSLPQASSLTSSRDICIENNIPGGCSNCIQGSSCSWSIDSHLCFSFSFQPITCAFGICGRVLRHYDVCPTSCNTKNYCYDCLEQYNCGWCTNPNENGQGLCAEGTLQGPYNEICSAKNKTTWVSFVCLPENECLNGHNQCNENETCVDLEISYKCECLSGYERINGSCIPICSQGCYHGSCIDPDQCLCSFGWVGTSCSIACQCNYKGQCVNETHLNVCYNCRDHTSGPSCNRCLPEYVGKDGECQSCYELCNEKTEICYNPDEKNTTEGSLYGASNRDNLQCECQGNSEGRLCEECKDGYFKSKQKCVKCKCRGHSDTCNKETGTHCNCQNKTLTPNNNDNSKQCSQCVSPYLGTPEVEGQQCYRDLKVLFYREFARENSGYENLLPLQTNFYFVQPSYTNMDIRLTIAISYGILDVYIANGDNAFKVDTNQNITVSWAKISSPEYFTDGLNTYTEYSRTSQVIVMKQMKHRLVVRFPSDEHSLDKAKFYIAIKAGEGGAKGIIYFKQNSTKMNLIVFFIVFASCFVFLLSAVSIAWSIKNHVNSRQEVHNRKIENDRLHNRPFAKFPFLFEYQSPSPSVIRHRKTTASTRKAVRPMSVQCTSDYHSTVTTVMFQLPQTDKTKMTVCLGTTLALVTSQQMDKLAQPSAQKQTTDL